MQIISWLVDFILHIDKHLAEIIKDYGTWTYLIIFGIIFAETGFVVTPFLPGDSLLFVIGDLGAKGALNIQMFTIVIIIAAVVGNIVNYFIGRTIGEKIVKSNTRFVKKEYIDRTHQFYEKHGGKALVLSRFVPIIRTFAPFVAGVGKMNFAKFFSYNLIGGVSWVISMTLAGYLFGGIPIIENNFTYVVFAIVFISLIPAVLTWINSKRLAKKSN